MLTFGMKAAPVSFPPPLRAPLTLAGAAWVAGEPSVWLTATLVGGLLAFGFVFAVNSSVHS